MSRAFVRWMVMPVLVATLMVTAAANAAEKEKKKPYPHYWLSIATTSQSMPGMPAEMAGMSGLFGGKSAFGPRRELLLQLESPQVTAGKPTAADEIPPGQKMGDSLPLATPKADSTNHEPG